MPISGRQYILHTMRRLSTAPLHGIFNAAILEVDYVLQERA